MCFFSHELVNEGVDVGQPDGAHGQKEKPSHGSDARVVGTVSKVLSVLGRYQISHADSFQ